MTVKRNTSHQRFGRRRLKRPLHSALEALERLGDLGFARDRLLALFFLFFNHLFRRSRHDGGEAKRQSIRHSGTARQRRTRNPDARHGAVFLDSGFALSARPGMTN